jgi:cytochrome c oxidase subunit 3
MADHSTATAEPHAHTHHGHEPGHGHGHGHDHGPFFAHHFESWQQQFDAGKLGIWAFLVQEVLFFSGLFCAYAVYRTLHPEVFEYAALFLSVPHGALNTVVLLFSSLTMAWGVRCAMLGQRTGLIVCLAITLFCAALFLGVKAYEYTEKYHAQLIWAGADPLTVSPAGITAGPATILRLDPEQRAEGEMLEQRLTASLNRFEFWVGLVGLLTLAIAVAVWFLQPERLGLAVTAGAIAMCAIAIVIGSRMSMGVHHLVHAAHDDAHHAAEHESDSPAAPGHLPEDTAGTAAGLAEGASHGGSIKAEPSRPQRLGTFFGIYYAMTGVHALHILGGMVVLTWLLVRAFKNHFTPEYFGPVDYVGLYWHLVDLIWIYLFPLLYLIG